MKDEYFTAIKDLMLVELGEKDDLEEDTLIVLRRKNTMNIHRYLNKKYNVVI